jgi:DNA-binding transcriptional LysR family regulator
MNISYLNTFITVIETGSFSAAARVLGLSQPAVSFQVQALEKEFGAVLLERRGAGLALTAAGELVLISAGRIVKNYEELVLSVNTARDMVTGRLVLEASTIPGEYIVPGLIGTFKEQYPQVDVTLNISDSREVVRRVHDRAADVGFTGALPDKSVKGIESTVLAEDALVLMVPAQHALAGKKSTPIKAVLGETFIMREPGSGTRKIFEQALKSAGLKPADIKISMELDSNQAVISAVEANLGVAVLSSWPAMKAAKLGAVAVLQVSDLDLKRDLYAVYDSGRPETPLRRAFLALL